MGVSKDPFQSHARNGKHLGAPALTCSRFLFLTNPCSTTQQNSPQAVIQDENELRVRITILPTFTAPLSLYFLSLTPLILRPRTTPTDTSRYHAAAVRSIFYLNSFSPPFMWLHPPYLFPITSSFKNAVTIQNIELALPLVEEGIAIEKFSSLSFSFLLTSMSSLSFGDCLQNSCSRNLGQSLAFGLFSRLSSVPLSRFFSCSWTTPSPS